MKLLKGLPRDRTLEQIQHHYRTEKAIADRLRQSSQEERTHIMATMYAELFQQVQDHPRLRKRQRVQTVATFNKGMRPLLQRFLRPTDRVAEFGPGDCRFTCEIAREVAFAYGIDISDQRNPVDTFPSNFQLIVYDGYRLDDIVEGSLDLVYSDQIIEHFHPDEVAGHFRLVWRLLKPGGRYVFRTPHALTGPHDVSQYFALEPEGFHLKEWSYVELRALLAQQGFRNFLPFWNARGAHWPMPYRYFALCEAIIGRLPRRRLRPLIRYWIPSLTMVAVK